ncbi:MAG: DUF1631 domain-containing protein [Gammaproteobacteria bacterium]|nr:DUF1631 domain-containing protein [Gammaproteobacteria bacterium]
MAIQQQINVARFMTAKSAKLLDECKQIASARLPAVIQQVMSTADDVLFTSAERAESSSRQSTFFDAMRELRLQRGDIERAFLAHFAQSYEDTIDPLAAVGGRASFASTQDMELALLAAQDMEEELAINNVVEKIKTQCREELYALDRRIGSILCDQDLVRSKNPLRPELIGHAFRAACQQFETDIEVKLTLYKLLDRFLCTEMNRVYHDINQYLIGEGVLPKIKTEVRANAPSGRTRITIESEAGTASAESGDVFSALQQLMAPTAGGNGGRGFVAGGIGYGGAGVGQGVGQGVGGATQAHGASAGATVWNTPQLVAKLTDLQRGGYGAVDAHGMGNVSPTVLNHLHALRGDVLVGAMNQTDSTTIEIVAILFDYFFNDRSIPDALKAVIGRLQIPVLKVALLDKELFSRKTHPARRLLDTLAEAAIGCSESGAQARDALFVEVERVVARICHDFDDDIAVFAATLAEFQAFTEQARRAAAERADRSAKSLHLKERLVLARLAVDDTLKPHLEDPEVREFARQFVLDYWRQLMVLTFVEHGIASEPWRQQLQTVVDLFQSLREPSTPEERRVLSAGLRGLLKRLRTGMAALNMPPREASKFLSMLASVHVVAVKRAEETRIAETAPKHIERVAEAPVAAAPGEAQPHDDAFIKEGMKRLFERDGLVVEEVDIDLTAAATAIDFDVAPEPVGQPEPDAGTRAVSVEDLDLGDWIEFRNALGTEVRGRFTWISPNSGRLLFTTKEGARALDTALPELAEGIRQGRIKIIKAEPDPIFDRAISALMDKMEGRA